MHYNFISCLLIAILFISTDAFAQMADAKVLGLEQAKVIADAAEERASQEKWTVAIAVVDAGGHLILLRRIDGTQTASVDIAISKARASVYYKRPTKAFQDRVEEGDVNVIGLPDIMPFEGGHQIECDGRVIGGIGISGVTAEQDGVIAQAGLESFKENYAQ